MINILKVATLFLSIFLSSVGATAVASGDCRKCAGTYLFRFDKAVTKAQAIDFFKKRIGGCAAENQFDIDKAVPVGCKRSPCKFWRVHVLIDRYCGKALSIKVGKTKSCNPKKETYGCVTWEFINLKCGVKVDCGGPCSCSVQPTSQASSSTSSFSRTSPRTHDWAHARTYWHNRSRLHPRTRLQSRTILHSSTSLQLSTVSNTSLHPNTAPTTSLHSSPTPSISSPSSVVLQSNGGPQSSASPQPTSAAHSSAVPKPSTLASSSRV